MPEKEMNRFFNLCYEAALGKQKVDISREALEALGLSQTDIEGINSFLTDRNQVPIRELAEFVVQHNQQHYQHHSDFPHPAEGLLVDINSNSSS